MSNGETIEAHSPTEALRPAAIGLATWVIWVIFTRPDRTPLLLMLSPFVIVPLGLAVIAPLAGPRPSRLLELVRPVVLPAAVIAALSFSFPAGSAMAGLSTLPWLAVTGCLATIGALRLASRRTLRHPAFGLDVGLIFIVVGGAWLTASRLDINLGGFGEVIVQLTAVHFHYAGFALPLVAGAIAERQGRGWPLPAAVTAGVPLTALGITVGGSLEWVAATVMALAGMAVAVLLLAEARAAVRRATDGPVAPLLFAVAGVALFGGMMLALAYSWSIRFGLDGPDIRLMVITHGVLNAIGFGLAALVALVVSTPKAPGPTGDADVLHAGRPGPDRLSGLLAQHRDEATTEEPGLLNRPMPAGFRRDVFRRPIDHGDRERARAAIESWGGHEAAGIRRVEAKPPIAVGSVVAMAIPVGPLAATAVARIVEVIDDERGWGFAYATLDHHPVSGEESFVITDGEAGLEIVVTAVWRPARLATAVCPPLTRLLQRRAIGRYLDGIANRPAPVTA